MNPYPATNYARPFLLTLCLALVCGMGMHTHAAAEKIFPAGIAYAGISHPGSAHLNIPASKPCDSCHSAGQLHTVENNIAASECITCHSVEKNPKQNLVFKKNFLRVGAPPNQAANPITEGKQIADTVTPPNIIPHKITGAAGMRYPQYYDESRVGAAANAMVHVPAGEFLMGSNSRLSDEGPQHSVTLPAFFIDQYEVTNLQYREFIRATKHKSPTHFSNRTFPDGRADHPVTFVSWHDAHDYCAWAGKRLPTSAEWEKAARGADQRTFPWGDHFAVDHANTPARWASLNEKGDTTPVGSFAQGISPYGAYDMSGNVWEWTDSWYTAYPGNTRPSENYGELYKTLKGGSWWDCTFYECGISAPVFNRAFFDTRVKNATFGFRCAKNSEIKNQITHGINKNENPK